MLEQRLVLHGHGLHEVGLDLQEHGAYLHEHGPDCDAAHDHAEGNEEEGHGPGCACGACGGGGLHDSGVEPHLLFAPDTPQAYIDQFRHEHGDNELAEFQLVDRFTSTATNGGGISLGESITVTWSIVRDGVTVPGYAGEATSPSNLVSHFRGIYGISHDPADTNYQGEAWFEAIESAFDRWSEISGVNYVYEANDDGANFVGASGVVGVRGDVRIAGHRIDGNSGTLAYNFYPNTSDMVIDTGDSFYNNTSNNSLRLRNVIAHEAGHGIGLAHVGSNNARFLMEPFIDLSFDGPQLDDILGAHRGYGDANEQGGGNDTSGNATSLGSIGIGQTVTIGDDADDTVVGANDTQFISIDDDSDVDYFSFTVAAGTEVDATLTPKGPTYNEGPQNGGQSPFNTAAQSNLTLQIIDTNGSTVLATANNTGIGGTEVLNDVALSGGGTYFVRVTGAQNAAQLFELSLTISSGVPATPGVTITESGGSTSVAEGGANDTYTIVLDSQPASNVTVTIGTGGEALTNAGSVTFTPTNWFNEQTVTVSADDDPDIEGNHSDTITHTVTSSDTDYNGISADSINVSITDNDSASLVITQSGGSTSVTEGGATDTYNVRLSARPTSDVTVNVTNTDGELTASVAQLTFTSANWDTNQTVTVTAVDDFDIEGNHNGRIRNNSTSSDGNFDGLSATVTASITDNDSAGVVITQSGGSTDVSEDGATDTYGIVLTSRPTNNVQINITNSDGELTTDLGNVVFTPLNWNVEQTVTVSAVDDADFEGNHTGVITHTAVSSDSNYGGIGVASVTANITDNDTAQPGVTITESGGSTDVAEGGANDTYTIVLDTQPTDDVTITLAPGTQLTTNVTGNTITFTSGDWDSARTVTVSAVDDSLVEGSHSGTITHTVSSNDTDYDGFAADSVTADITDNDTAGVLITESGGTTDISEDGITDTYTVVLTSQPSSPVTIDITPDNQLFTYEFSLTFDSFNWHQPQTVIVEAIDDLDVEGNHTGTITHTVNTSAVEYNGVTARNVVAFITDNDQGSGPEPIYFSLQSAALAGGIVVQNEDIATWDGSNFTMLFDGSDVGLGGLEIDAFDVISDNEILLSFTTSSFGGIVDDSDIVLFVADSLGQNTSGTFYWYFDASDVGLTASGEDIDAMTLLFDGSLLISTNGGGNVPGLSFSDEDIILFTPFSIGSNTSGTFSMFLDGSDPNVGLSESSGEDIDGLAMRNGELYLTTGGNFSVPGVFGADDDVFVYDLSTGTYDPDLYVNFTSNDLKGLDFAGVGGFIDDAPGFVRQGNTDGLRQLEQLGGSPDDSVTVSRRDFRSRASNVDFSGGDSYRLTLSGSVNVDNSTQQFAQRTHWQQFSATPQSGTTFELNLNGVEDEDSKRDVSRNGRDAIATLLDHVFSDRIGGVLEKI